MEGNFEANPVSFDVLLNLPSFFNKGEYATREDEEEMDMLKEVPEVPDREQEELNIFYDDFLD